MDASGSIRENRFDIVTDFVKSIVDQMEVANDRVRVGVVSYSDNAYIQFQLNTYDRKDDVLQVNVTFRCTNSLRPFLKLLDYPQSVLYFS